MKKRPRNITMRDVARMSGVSQSTVSRVLSRTTSPVPISEETVARVYDAVKVLGYHPNMTARSLRTQRTHMIAVMIADISNPFYHSITRTIQDVAQHHDYDVLIANTDHLIEYERRFCDSMMRRPVDGIVMVPYHLSDDDLGDLMEHTGAEIVALGGHIHHPGIDVVHSDDELATYDAIRWLIEQRGHRRIGFIHVPDASPAERRLNGYKRALQDCGLAFCADDVQPGNWTVESGEQAIKTLLALPEPPTAIFACNDHMAIGALNQALDLKVRIPEDLAIVGFDNIPETTLVRPRLTTVAQYPVEIGSLLARALFERIDQLYAGPRRLLTSKLEVIVRETT